MSNIIVLEDESLVREYLCEEIRKYIPDGKLYPCKSYAEVEEVVRSTIVSLAFLDIHIGSKPDGVDAGKLIRGKTDAQITFLSAYTDRSTMQRAAEVQPEAYLTKPINPTQLEATISMLNNAKLKMEKGNRDEKAVNQIQEVVTDLERLAHQIRVSDPYSAGIKEWFSYHESVLEKFKLFVRSPTVQSVSDCIDGFWISSVKLQRSSQNSENLRIIEYVEKANLAVEVTRKFALSKIA